MMQFLKSTLFPASIKSKKSKKSRSSQEDQIFLLKKRVQMLELENRKVNETLKELSACVQSISVVMADFATEITFLSSHVASQGRPRSSYEDDILNRYLSNIDDDDDGYLN